MSSCYDCARPYGDEHGFPDLVIPNDVWEEISPKGNGGGLLCPSCICKRLYDAGIECVGIFTSGPLVGTARKLSALMPQSMARGLGYDLDGNCPALLAEKDRQEIERGIPRAAGGAACSCGLEMRQHPPVQGALWLTRSCDGIVKL